VLAEAVIVERNPYFAVAKPDPEYNEIKIMLKESIPLDESRAKIIRSFVIYDLHLQYEKRF
jgi:hypothetical protein